MTQLFCDQNQNRDPETFNNLVIFTTDPNVSNHCDNMMEMVESLEDYLTIKVERVNVWRSQMNFKLFEKFDRRECNGLPLLVNRKTGARICGISTKQNLLNWATGKKTEFMPEMYPDDMDSPNEDDAPF